MNFLFILKKYIQLFCVDVYHVFVPQKLNWLRSNELLFTCQGKYERKGCLGVLEKAVGLFLDIFQDEIPLPRRNVEAVGQHHTRHWMINEQQFLFYCKIVLFLKHGYIAPINMWYTSSTHCNIFTMMPHRLCSNIWILLKSLWVPINDTSRNWRTTQIVRVSSS